MSRRFHHSRLPSSRLAAAFTAALLGTAIAASAMPALAAPAATATLQPVATAWVSPTPVDQTDAAATGVITFGTKTWIVGNLWHGGKVGPLVQAAVQECTGTTCVMSVLPGRTGTFSGGTALFAPQVSGITGTSATDLWAYGSLHTGNNVRVPQFWHYDGTAWSKVWEAGIEGEAYVKQVAISPAGERWALVDEDFDGITTVVYRRVGTTWTQVDSRSARAFPAPCNVGVDSWYEQIWRDLVFVGGEPTVVGQCPNGTSVVFKRSGSSWRRIDPALSTVPEWSNAAVVNSQLWIQGTSADGQTITILKRVNGAWVGMPTTGIPAGAQVTEMAGTLASNVWLIGSVRGTDGVWRGTAWRWTGSTWRAIQPVASPSAVPAGLVAVSARGTTPAWVAARQSAFRER